MNFMRLFTIWNVLEQFKRQHPKHYKNDADELKRYGFFKKSKASVVKLNELNPEPVLWNHCHVQQHDDQGKEHYHDGANLDQLCRQ